MVSNPIGSMLNQKLNLSGFKQFGMRLTTAQSGILPVMTNIGNNGKPQPAPPVIDDDMFSSYKHQVRPPINPYANKLNEMH